MLTEKLQSMEQKVDKFSGELGVVRTKVDLAMMSISLIQQEQVQVTKFIKAALSSSATSVDAGVMGPPPAGRASTASAGTPPPPHLPSLQLLRHQVNSIESPLTMDASHSVPDRSEP
jgi:hypothetical protein